MLGTKRKTTGHQAHVKPSQTLRDIAPSHPIRDFIVEIFGILLPGFAFTTGLVFTIVLPLYMLVVSQQGDGLLSISSSDTEVWKALQAFHLALIVAGAALSYVLGHVFARQDLKLPDTISYWGLPEHSRRAAPVGYRGAHSKRLSIKTWHDHIWEAIHVSTLCDKIERGGIARYPRLINFPYCSLNEWFDAQRRRGLAKIVTWPQFQDNGTRPFDLMKIGLGFAFPEQCLQLTRIEAHVRLACSIWYASCHLICWAVIGIFVAVLANRLAEPYAVPYLAALLVPGFSLIVLIWLKGSIERTLHPMRIREIVFAVTHFRCARQIAPKIMDVLAAPLLDMESGQARSRRGDVYVAMGSRNAEQRGRDAARTRPAVNLATKLSTEVKSERKRVEAAPARQLSGVAPSAVSSRAPHQPRRSRTRRLDVLDHPLDELLAENGCE
jgi:hypothetical protein